MLVLTYFNQSSGKQQSPSFFPSSHSAQTLATKKQLEAEDLYKLNEAPVNVSVIVHVHKQPQHFLSFLHQSCSDL